MAAVGVKDVVRGEVEGNSGFQFLSCWFCFLTAG